MPLDSKFPAKHAAVMKQDIGEAKRLAKKCLNALLIGPNRPTMRTMGLLADTFHINPRDFESDLGWKQVGPVRQAFEMCTARIDRLTFIFSESPTAAHKMEYGAYVLPGKPHDVYVTHEYFKHGTKRERAALLIHEMIHLIHPAAGHPGGKKLNFHRTRMNIPYESAIKNPYCYQYFAEWLAAEPTS